MLKKLLDLLSDVAVYGVSSMLTRIVGLLLLPLLTRYLTPAEYGVMTMLSVVSLLFAPLARLGMTNAIFRRFSFEKDPRARAEVLTTGLACVTCSSIVLLVICMLFAEPIAQYVVGDAGTVALVRVSLLTSAIGVIGMVPFVTLRAARRVKTAATINVSKVLISMVVTVCLLVIWELGIWAVVWSAFVAEVVITAVQLVLTASSFRAGFSWAVWKRMATYGFPFVPQQFLAVAMDLFGVYMVREMLGLGAAGMYGVATRFASPVKFIVTSVQQSWTPYKFQVHAQDSDSKAFFQSMFTYYIAAISYLWVGVALWGPEVLRLIAGDEFQEAAFLVGAVALVPVMQGIYFMSGTGIELSDRTGSLPLMGLAGLVTVVVTALLLVPRIDAYGAALATSLGWAAMGVVAYTLSQRRFAISYDWPTIGWFALMASVFVVTGAMVQSKPLWVRLTLTTVLSLAYPLNCLFLLLRSRDERGRMLHILSKFRLMPSNR